jgi:hypothetical protein
VIEQLITSSQGGSGVLNTAYIERLNAIPQAEQCVDLSCTAHTGTGTKGRDHRSRSLFRKRNWLCLQLVHLASQFTIVVIQHTDHATVGESDAGDGGRAD